MGSCLKGESKVKQKDAKFTCDKCGAGAAKKDQLCKPEKVGVEIKDKKAKKKKKEKKK